MVGGTHPSERERERESIVPDYAITTHVIHMLYFFWFMLNTFYMVGCMSKKKNFQEGVNHAF